MIAYKTSKNARVLFVGINPHPGSYRRGVPFSNNKMFWYDGGTILPVSRDAAPVRFTFCISPDYDSLADHPKQVVLGLSYVATRNPPDGSWQVALLKADSLLMKAEVNVNASRSGLIRSYAELQEQIHRDLLAQNPDWIESDGNCPKCDEYDRRFAELISIFRAVSLNLVRKAA